MKKTIILVAFLIIVMGDVKAPKTFSRSASQDKISSSNTTKNESNDKTNLVESNKQQSKFVPEYQHKPKTKVSLSKIRWSNPTIRIGKGSADYLPSNMIKQTNFDIKLAPGSSYHFNLPLQNGGSLITLRFYPNEKSKGTRGKKYIKKSRKNKFKPVNSGYLGRAITKLIQEQQQMLNRKILTFKLYVGQKLFLPINDLSSQYKFLTKVKQNYSRYKTGNGIIKNLENKPIAGKVFVSVIDLMKKERFEGKRRSKNIQDAIEKFRNPDMLWVLNHTLKRYMRGYPGGMSDFEKVFAKNLSNSGVSKSIIQKISRILQPFETQIASKVKDRNLIKLTTSQAVKNNRLRSILNNIRIKTRPNYSKTRKAQIGSNLRGKSFTFKSELDNSRSIQYQSIPSGSNFSLMYTWEITSEEERERSAFKVVPGLADKNDFSFESLFSPGYYISSGKDFSLALNLGLSKKSNDIKYKKRATFKMVQALTGDPLPRISIESYLYPGKYIYDIGPGSTFSHILQLGNIKHQVKFKKAATFLASSTLRENKIEKYKIRLLGIMSHRCADDEGWEYGCDTEEPYILWACFGPKYDACGRTDHGRGVEKNDFYIYSTDVNVFGGGGNRKISERIHSPLIYVYMVLERDSGSPSREDILGCANAAISITKAAYGNDWVEVAKSGVEFIYDAITIFQKIAAKGDDIYPPYIAVFNENNLLTATSQGSNPPPLDRALVNSVGNYDHLSIREVKIFKRKRLQWSVFYLILRD